MTDITSLKANGGADLTKLEVGTKLYIETTAAVYLFTVLTPSTGQIVVESSQSPFQAGTMCPCILVRSDWDDKGKVTLPHWIGKAMRMVLKVGDRLHATHSVVSTRVEAADGSWNYELWDVELPDREN